MALAARVALAPGLVWASFAMRREPHDLVYWKLGNNLSYIDNPPLATEWIGRAAATLLRSCGDGRLVERGGPRQLLVGPRTASTATPW